MITQSQSLPQNLTTSSRFALLGLLSVWLSILSPNDARADGYKGTIYAAETHTGLSITSIGGIDTWTFTGNRGARIIVNAVTTTGSLDTTIVLYNPQGNIETSTVQCCGGGGGDQLDWQLADNGLYTIAIEDYNLTSTGGYNITFFETAGAVTSSSNPYGGQIVSAETTNGNISAKSDMNAFQFAGQKGDRIILNAVTTSGTLDTTIVLYPPTGGDAEASTVQCCGGGGGDQLDCQLQNTGLYTVLVQDYSLTSIGAYNLTFFKINAALTSSSNPYGGQIVSAETTNGNISVKSDMNAFQFAGQKGGRIILNAVTTSGTLDTTIVLYPPTGGDAEASTVQCCGGGGGDQMDYQLQNSGLYTVLVQDYNLTYTGTYKVTFFKIPGAPTSESNPYGGMITPGQATAGYIQSKSDMNEFQFYGLKGQAIVINAVTTNGPLDTTIVLYPPTGDSAEVSTVQCCGGGGGDQLNWHLLTNGLYSVLIQDYGLSSTGKYALSFTTIPPIINSGLYNPIPSLGQTLTSLPAALGWGAVSNATGYDLYFSKDITSVLQRVGTNFSTASFPFPSVVNQTVCYWQVVAHTPSGNVQSPYWWFRVAIPPNAAPILPIIANTNIDELTPLTVSDTATDSDVHSTLSYVLLNPPAGAVINLSGIITWTPNQIQSPSTNVITTVATSTDNLDTTNPQLSSTNSFSVIVREVNVAPVLPPIADQTVNELILLTVTNTAGDSNIHAAVSYALLNPPNGATISAGGVITWTPTQAQSHSTNIITTVATSTDNLDTINSQLSSTNRFTVFVKEVNVAPVLPVVPPTTIAALTLLTVTNTATDANIHSTVGYSLLSPPAGVAISASGVITWTPSQSQSPSTNTITTVATSTNSFDQGNPQLSASNSFTVIVTNQGVAPTITIPPASQTNVLGTSVTFTVSATGTPPLSYQWYFGSNPGIPISGATNPSYSIASVQESNAGVYAVVVTNAYGTANATATLTIARPLSVPITIYSTGLDDRSNPLPPGGRDPHYRIVSAPAGVPATPFAPYVVNTNGYPFNGIWLVDDAASQWVGVESNYTVSSQDPVGPYDYRTTFDLTGLDPASATITFQVIADNLIQDVRINGTTTGLIFPAPLDFLTWSKPFEISTNFAPGTNTLDFLVYNTAPDGGNPCGLRLLISGTASLSTNVPPTIITPPASQTNAVGTAATFAVVAAGTPPLSYQWYFGNNVISGATNAAYSIASIQPSDGGSYMVVVTNAYGMTNATAELTVIVTPPSVTISPTNETVFEGATASFSATASGTPPFTYQWLFDGTAIATATNSTLTLADVQPSAAGSYSVVVANIAGTANNGVNATLVVPVFLVTHSGGAYNSPGTCTITCQIGWALDQSLVSLVIEPVLPFGWTILGASGQGNPQVENGKISVSESTAPNPLTFRYTVAVPAGQTGPQNIQDKLFYFLSGLSDPASYLATPNPLIVNPGATLTVVVRDGQLILGLSGNSGANYALLSSTDLVSWSPAGNLVPVNGVVQTNLPITGSKMFYRAVLGN